MPIAKRKKLLTIGQVAKLLRVSASSLRNWEQLGLVTPVRDANGYRLYPAAAVQQLKRVQFLRRVKRVNPSGILHLRRQDSELLGQPAPTAVETGARLARMRQTRRLSLAEAAQRAGLRPPALSQIERGAQMPSIAAFQRLTALYGTSVLAFFNSAGAPRALVRPRDRGVLLEPGVRMELLAFGHICMEVLLFRVEPRATSGGGYTHEGEEIIYMLSGKFEIWLDETERYVLEPGDSLYFSSTREHRWGCVGDEEAVLLWINSPPTF
jgi:DNA-binding transcriptional MerR regulator/mannose-6-phosphate isomerase-like protein (cupin superfamily)